MKCQRAQRHIQAGLADELDFATRRKLEEHLASCPSCRAARAAAMRLTAQAALHLPRPEPAPAADQAVRARIRAVVRQPRRSAWHHARYALRAGLAAAATLLLILGWQTARPQPHRQRIETMHTLLAVLADDPAVFETATESADRQRALREFGRELLLSQGLLDFEDAPYSWPFLEVDEPDALHIL
jgi:anti-sigma factor RsiW